MKTKKASQPQFVRDGSPSTESTRALLREVGAIASSAICLTLPGSGEAGDETGADRMLLLRQALERVGWVTDVALRQLGEPGAFASAEDWMLAHV
ncbi:hypothetical protein GT347_25610 [Xylophilus rhododendri]|uniref:Uncharacterized protein n=1 Tax=Xylophilus rhododendri TaxID=2697032 RepID=A0A857JDM6_9BURK|nr:hypothetical protein [Xylophilus rhododendri]QHJ01063.1 hypothetical protein GT347_25610 [Xylophilus rhododendri]